MKKMMLCIVLIMVMALFTTGCNDNTKKDEMAQPTGTETIVDAYVLGEGETEFVFTVTDVDGNETYFTIHTDKTYVGEALEEVGLIEGEEGPYGLFVKTVNGITIDYDTDGKYWAFYVDGEYASAGIDVTEIVENTKYSLKAE